MNERFVCGIMDGKFTGTKTSKDQSIEQALRRLKYLHTSLMPHEARTRQNVPKIDEKNLLTKGLQPGNDKQFIKARRTPEKQYCLSLQPKTSKTPGEKAKSRVRVKRKQEKKPLRTGRAPLLACRVPSSSSAKDEIRESKSDNGIILEDYTVGIAEERASKSAPGAFCTSDPYKCIQCFTSDFGERAHRKKATKQYFTNMRINRVTFSARPSGYKVKSVRESKIEVPKSCFFNGWGVRSQKESLPKGNTNNDLKRQASKETIDVTVGLKTLRLEPKRLQQEYTEQTIPQPPPTPVRQIDIKLPQGVMVRYQLPEDD